MLTYFPLQNSLPTAAFALVGTALIVGSSLFWTWGVFRWKRRPVVRSIDSPSVSVLIVGRNEELYIRAVLESVLKCDYPPDKFSVYFIDDHSDDQTLRIASEVAAQDGGRLYVSSTPPVSKGRSPKKSALAFGVQQTSSDLLLFTDADSIVHPGWIRSVVNSYDSDTGAVAGATIPTSGSGLHHRFYRLERFMTGLTSASAIGHGSPASVTGQNFSFRRAAFEDVGGYAHMTAASGDDDLMAQAIAQRGWTVKFCADPDSVVTDLRPPDVRSHLAAASRHQSTTRFYPLRWRLVYLVTILANWCLMAGVVFSLVDRELLGMAVLVLGLKFLVDAVGVRVFSRQLHIRLTLAEFLISEVLLPVYLMVRPLLILRSSFDWRGRTHPTTSQTSAEMLP